jgi:hypothetical protein
MHINEQDLDTLREAGFSLEGAIHDIFSVYTRYREDHEAFDVIMVERSLSSCVFTVYPAHRIKMDEFDRITTATIEQALSWLEEHA